MEMFRVSINTIEEVERMAEKYETRAEALYNDWREGGYETVGYGKITIEEAERCQGLAGEITNLLLEVQGSVSEPIATREVIEQLNNIMNECIDLCPITPALEKVLIETRKTKGKTFLVTQSLSEFELSNEKK